MNKLNKDLISILSFIGLVIFSILPIFNIAQCESNLERTQSAIDEADSALGFAYLSLLKAERKGGDISELVELLNTAIDDYSEAKKALDLGEYEEAINLAEKVIKTSNEVLKTDISVIVIAKHLGEVEYRNQIYLSSGVVCFTILLYFVGWRLFKSYYLRNMKVSKTGRS